MRLLVATILCLSMCVASCSKLNIVSTNALKSHAVDNDPSNPGQAENILAVSIENESEVTIIIKKQDDKKDDETRNKDKDKTGKDENNDNDNNKDKDLIVNIDIHKSKNCTGAIVDSFKNVTGSINVSIPLENDAGWLSFKIKMSDGSSKCEVFPYNNLKRLDVTLTKLAGTSIKADLDFISQGANVSLFNDATCKSLIKTQKNMSAPTGSITFADASSTLVAIKFMK